jgi:hypothetical protein
VQRGFCGIGCAFEITDADCLGIGDRDLSQNGEKLFADFLAMRAIRIGRENRGDGAVLHFLHHKKRPLQCSTIQLQRHRFRNGKAEFVKRFISAELGGAFGFDQAGRRIAPEDQRAVAARILCAEAIGFAARAAGNTGDVRHF